MPIPTNKEELVNAIIESYNKLKKELETIPYNQTFNKELEGHAKGTQMSIDNLISYLIGWGELVLKWIYKKDNHLSVSFPEEGYKWNELGKLAQKFYRDYENKNHEQLILELDTTVTKILNTIQHKANHELYEIPWYKKWTLGRMIQFNTSSPYTNARSRIRKWKKQKEFL